MRPHQLINQTSGRTEWVTPDYILDAARHALASGFDLDPASTPAANRRVRAARIYTIGEDGLSQPWRGRVWLNWPFSRKGNRLWVSKLVGEFESGRVTAACCISFASTSETWFKALLSRPQCYIWGRVNYLLPSGDAMHGCTRGSVVTYFGHDVARFAHSFRHIGEIKVPYSKVNPIALAAFPLMASESDETA
jgi:hypothetical protein